MPGSQTPQVLIGRRYLLQDRLGAGGMGTVYRALDRLTGQHMALKRVLPPDARSGSSSRTLSVDRRVALVREFELLASLRHPHIISVLDYGFDLSTIEPEDDEGPHPYFTMDLLEGSRTIVDAAAGQSLHQRLTWIVQMLQALAYLHRRGILHRDLKPGNVIVHDGQVRLLDFGLATLLFEDSQNVGTTAGTLAYMAPEVLRGEGAAEVSDLYAVGVIACEAIGGRHPFEAENPANLVTQIINKSPDLSYLSVSDALSGVLNRLLAKNPAARYPTAAAAIEALNAAVEGMFEVEPATVRESFLQAARFVGREVELGLLIEALSRAIDGKGSAWLVGGESGVGKTRLLGELRTRALVRGALVLRSQARREGGGPYQSWHDVVRWLSLLADPSDAEASVLKVVAPEIGDLLGRPVPDAPALPPEAAQERLHAVLGTLLRRHAEPVVIILEDLQWMGGESLAILAHLAEQVEDLPVLIVGSFRHDERADLPSHLKAMRLLPLDRFGEEHIAELAESMLGSVGRQSALLELLKKETEGNAYFVVEVVRALAEEARQLEDIGQMALPERVVAGGIDQILQRRLDRVPEEARPLLEMAAVAGRWLDMSVINRALIGTMRDPQAEIRLARSLVDCSDAAVFDVQLGRWCFAHDKLRERLLETLSEERKRTLHRQVAEAIVAVHPDPELQARALAHHWQQAGDAIQEARWAETAGYQFLETSCFAEAMAHLDRALELVCDPAVGAPDVPARQAALRNALGEAAIGMSDFARAEQVYRENTAHCEQIGDRSGLARAQRGLGEVFDGRGDYPAARTHLEQSLALCQATNDKRCLADTLHWLGRIEEKTGEYAKAAEHHLASLALCRELGYKQGEADALRVLGSTYSMLGEFDKARQSWLDSLAISQSLGNRRGVAGCLNNLGVSAEMRNDFAEAKRFYAMSLAIKREIGDRRGAGITLSNIGVAHYYLGEYEASKGVLEEGRAIFEAIGDRQGIADVLNNQGLCEYSLGHYDTARAQLEECLAICRDLGDPWGEALALLNIAKCWREQAQPERARPVFFEAMRTAFAINRLPTLLEVFQEYAALAVKEQQPEQAARLLGVVIEHPKTPGAIRARAEAALTGLAATLPADALAQARERGKDQDLGVLVDEITERAGKV